IVVVLIVLYTRSRDGWKQADWTTVDDDEQQRRFAEAERERAATYASVSAAIAALKGKDEDFSLVLFEDFLYALYAEVQTARGEGSLAKLAPYLSEGARRAYAD